MWTPEQTTAALAFPGRPERHVTIEASRYLAESARWDSIARNRFVTDLQDVLILQCRPDDVQITAHRATTVGNVVESFRLLPRWRPGCLVAEFRGGPAHHQVHELRDLRPLRVHGFAAPVSFSEPPASATVDVTEVEYRMSMWLPDSRVWVFTPA